MLQEIASMPKLIPTLSETQIREIKSRAEQRFYNACRDQLSNEWLVVHSIPFVITVSDAPRDGEADFVFFSPSKGILVVEIKGGGVEYDPTRGMWSSTDVDGKVHPIKDPFQQGVIEKKAILNSIKNDSRWPRLRISKLNCGHAVFLLDIDDIKPLEMLESPCEIMGCRSDLRSLEAWLNKVLTFWQGKQHGAQGLGPEGMKIIEQIFCTPKRVKPLLSALVRDEEDRRIELSAQQSVYLRAIGKRKRAVVCGGAGTGKTLLAVDRATQLAKSGAKTLLLCYNRPLAHHLKDVIGQNKNLFPMDFHELCKWRSELALNKFARDLVSEAKHAYPNSDYFHVQLPYALLLSTELFPDYRFDAVIVDEGQDFREDYWLPLEMLLRDEKESYLYVFLDPNQALYQQNSQLPIKDEPFPLTVNCRNTRYIHEAAYKFYRGDPIDPPGIEGAPIELHEKESFLEQVNDLHSYISSLISTEKLESRDIVVLVAGPAKNAYYKPLESRTLPGGIKYSIEEHRVPNTVLVDTVERFKGLESSMLMLWGLDEYYPEQDKEALYVAFSRAKSRLHLFGTKAACQRVLEIRY
jgi:hypothetical protein